MLWQTSLANEIKCSQVLGNPEIVDCYRLLLVMENRLLSIAKDGYTDPHAKTKTRHWGLPGQSPNDPQDCRPWSSGVCNPIEIRVSCLMI